MKKLALTVFMFTSLHVSANALTEAQMNIVCGETKAIVSMIRNVPEQLVWTGKEESGVVVSMWLHPTTRSFTVLKTSANGEVSCVISSGGPQGKPT